jgi:hypothetical protein
MTQTQFIQHLLDNYCDVSEDIGGTHYQCKKRGARGNSIKTTMPLGEGDRRMEMASMCIICYSLGIIHPNEVNDYYEKFFEPEIIKKHLKK